MSRYSGLFSSTSRRRSRPQPAGDAGGVHLDRYRSSLRHLPHDPDWAPPGVLCRAESRQSGGSRRAQGTRASRAVAWHTFLLVITRLPVVFLAKYLATLVDHGIAVVGPPPALGGVSIALIVFAPEAITALRVALYDQLQQSINLSLGASASTIGLTVPAILGVGFLTDKVMLLGLDPAGMTLLALTLGLSTLTFSGPRTTMLAGMVHLIVFLAYVVSIFSS